MSPCLTERTLMLLRAGEGGAEEHAHLRACPECGLRYRELADDLAVIATALRGNPPPAAAHVAPARWRAVGAVAATVLLAVAAGRLWRGGPAERAGDMGTVSEELADTLFATPEAAAAGEEPASEVATLDDDDELALLFDGP